MPEASDRVPLTAADQKLARMSLNWVLHETYSPEWRPALEGIDLLAMAALLARLEADRSAAGRPIVLAGEERPALLLAAQSFCRALWAIRGEFEIVTGLPPEAGESLLSRLG